MENYKYPVQPKDLRKNSRRFWIAILCVLFILQNLLPWLLKMKFDTGGEGLYLIYMILIDFIVLFYLGPVAYSRFNNWIDGVTPEMLQKQEEEKDHLTADQVLLIDQVQQKTNNDRTPPFDQDGINGYIVSIMAYLNVNVRNKNILYSDYMAACLLVKKLQQTIDGNK